MSQSPLANIDPLIFFNVSDMPSFVDCERAPVDFFASQSTGDDHLDLQRGTQLAVEAMAYAKRYRSSACIAFALCAIAERSRVGLLEAGFITRIADAAAAGSMN